MLLHSFSTAHILFTLPPTSSTKEVVVTAAVQLSSASTLNVQFRHDRRRMTATAAAAIVIVIVMAIVIIERTIEGTNPVCYLGAPGPDKQQ